MPPVFPSPLVGEGALRSGEGLYNIYTLSLLYTPHRRYAAASPARGEATHKNCILKDHEYICI